MKLKPEPREIDLYVDSTPLTEKERKELTEFIKKLQDKDKLKARKKRAGRKLKKAA